MQGEQQKEEFKIVNFVYESITIILPIAMAYMHAYALLILGVLLIQFILMIRMNKQRRRIHAVILSITILICAILIIYGEKYDEKNKIPENVERAELQIDLSKLILKYSDGHGTNELTTQITDELVPEVIKFESYDYDVTIDDYKIKDGKLIINEVPVGNCGVEIKFEKYDLVSEKYKLNKKDLKNEKWIKNLVLQEEGDYKNFQIQLVDLNGNPLEGKRCDICVDGNNEEITDLITDASGKISYSFTCKAEDIIYLILHAEEEVYKKKIDVNSNSSLIKIMYEEVLSEKSLKENEYKQRIEQLKEDSANQEQLEGQENPRKFLKNENLDMGSLRTEGTLIKQWEDALTQDEREKTVNFTLSENGGVWIEFLHQNLTLDANAWKIMISDANGEVHMEFTSSMSKENTVSQFVGLQAGEYWVKVASNSLFSDALYQVKIFQNIKANYDMEPDGETLTANNFKEMKNNEVQTIYGNLTDIEDVDYYCFELLQKGVVALDFKHENFTDNTDGWYIRIKNSDSEELCYFSINWQVTQTGSPNIGLEAGKYYIEIGYYGNLNTEPYALSIVWHESDYWESEFNNTILNADNLIVGYYQHGSLMSRDDVDYYMFTCEKTGKYKLFFEHENLTKDDVGWNIDILDENSAKVIDETIQSTWKETVVNQGVYLTEGNTYYISVSGSAIFSDADYKLKIEE